MLKLKKVASYFLVLLLAILNFGMVISANAIVDTTPPDLWLLGENPITIEVGQDYEEFNAIASDEVDGILDVTISGTVNTGLVDTYIITYSATDLSENIGTITRTVNVVDIAIVDTTPPDLWLLGENPITIEVGQDYEEFNAIASDEVDGILDVIISGTVNTGLVDTYIITYSAIDLSENIGTITRTVNVIPVPTSPAATPPPSSGGGGGSILISQPKQPEVKNESIIVPEEEVEVLGVELDYRTIQLNKILSEAEIVNSGDVNLILANTGKTRDLASESDGYNKYILSLIAGLELSDENINKITYFIVYGTETTQILGAGERAGVINSYKSAFGKLPTTQSDWEDVIKIANGRWPSERSEQAENKAKAEFKKVYLRDADMDNANDDAAVTIMAYGLRPDNRNLDSEKAAIKIFKAIYGYNPASATDWDIARAIAYSGAAR